MAHIPVRHPAGDLRSCKSTFLPICHMLFLDGIYTETKQGKDHFQRTRAPERQERVLLVHVLSQRIARFLERMGLLERDAESSYLQLDDIDEDPMHWVLGCSVNYRIAIGPQQGRKVFRLKTIPAREDNIRFAQGAKESGFSPPSVAKAASVMKMKT
jgi:hypothetical protein